MEAFERIHNSCARCGRPLPGDVAYAENRDDAVAGRGICVDCASAKFASGGVIAAPTIALIGEAYSDAIRVPDGAVVVNLSDGVDDDEANVSGKALRRRRKSPGGAK